MKSTRSFRLSVAPLFEFPTSARLIQPTQIPLVGIVTQCPFTDCSTRTLEQADTVRGFFSQATLWYTHQQGSLQCPPFQATVSHPPEPLVTRVPSGQRVLMAKSHDTSTRRPSRSLV